MKLVAKARTVYTLEIEGVELHNMDLISTWEGYSKFEGTDGYVIARKIKRKRSEPNYFGRLLHFEVDDYEIIEFSENIRDKFECVNGVEKLQVAII